MFDGGRLRQVTKSHMYGSTMDTVKCLEGLIYKKVNVYGASMLIL